jgi:hypothetical protein
MNISSEDIEIGERETSKKINFNKLPKLEFHGHFNGLIPDYLLDKYIYEKNIKSENFNLNFQKKFSYENFFTIINKVSDSLAMNKEFKSEALDSIVQDYISQNCVYLELRDTLRDGSFNLNDKNTLNSNSRRTVYDYAMQLFEKLKLTQEKYKDEILIKFFLNLHKSKNKLSNNIEILEAFKLLPDEIKKFILGIDIGGQDFNFNYFEENKYIYQYFRSLGYKLNFHLYEKEEEKYFREIINFRPDRISQCVYLKKQDELDLLIRSGIPLEILPSFSLNLTNRQKLSQLENYVYLFQQGHPMLIGTDNRYILNTCLTKEYEKYYEFMYDVSIREGNIDLYDNFDIFSDEKYFVDKINNVKLAFDSSTGSQSDYDIINKVEELQMKIQINNKYYSN